MNRKNGHENVSLRFEISKKKQFTFRMFERDNKK